MSVTQRIPDLGLSPLEEAFANYKTMEQHLGAARDELASKSDMLNDLLRENEFLRRNYDKAVAERDRYQALAVNLATRAVGVREAVERLLAEAVSAKAPPVVASPEGAGELETAMTELLADPTKPHPNAIEWMPEPGVIKRDITRRTTLAPNEFR